MNTVAGILDQAINGAGCVVGVIGPPGIGKSRIMREAVTLATARGVEVFTVTCESHTREVPFHVVARLLRTVFGVNDLDEQAGPGAGACPQSPTPTPRTCCCSTTCSESATPTPRCPPSPPMPVGAGWRPC